MFTGFSGGVDSFATIADHSDYRVPPEYKVNHLLFNNVGAHGQGKEGLKLFWTRYARQQSIAQRLKLPFIAVNSNLDSVMNTDFQLTHTLRNVAVALLFQKACAKFLYSSAVHYRDSYVKETHDMGYADAIGIPLLSTETTECISSGSQYSRFEKTEIISSAEETYKALDVCNGPQLGTHDINCSKCSKCLRTELSLEVIGSLAKYDAVFDLYTYRKFRWLHICHVMGSHSVLLKEIKDGIKRHNFRVPRSARLVAAIVPNKLIYLILDVWGWSGTDNPVKIGRNVVRLLADRARKRR